MKKYVAYLRVSSKRQKVEGISLQAQAQIVYNYTKDGVVIGTFSEAVSGSYRSFHKRHQLKAAIKMCLQQDATLVVAVSDRLSRSVYHTADFLHSGVKFILCDMPECTREMLLMSSIFAEHEHRRISGRAKDAHAYKRSIGIKHITRKPNKKYHVKDSTKKLISTALRFNYINDEHIIRAYQIAKSLRTQKMTLKDIAAAFVNMRIPGAGGRITKWRDITVSKLLNKGEYIEGIMGLYKIKSDGTLAPENVRELNKNLSKTLYNTGLITTKKISIRDFDRSGEADEWLIKETNK